MQYDFHEPLNEEEDGTYITIGQMHFFLNRPDGNKKFSKADPEFLKYYNSCRFYNLVSDMIDKKQCDDSVYFYWDEKHQEVCCEFPLEGKVAQAVADMILYIEEDGEEWDGL